MPLLHLLLHNVDYCLVETFLLKDPSCECRSVQDLGARELLYLVLHQEHRVLGVDLALWDDLGLICDGLVLLG